jgi:ribose/xylose/arabinose/galactoside ABC-type transport system permease subunit
VLGGVDPFGGFGKVGGLMMALILLQVISSALNLLNFSPFLTVAIWGALIIGVTALAVLREGLGGLRRQVSSRLLRGRFDPAPQVDSGKENLKGAKSTL